MKDKKLSPEMTNPENSIIPRLVTADDHQAARRCIVAGRKQSYHVVEYHADGGRVVVASRATENTVIAARNKLKIQNPNGILRIWQSDGTVLMQAGVIGKPYLVPDQDMFEDTCDPPKG